MENDLIWTKTILSVYRYLERICGAIDKIVMQSALNSTNILGQNYHYNNVYSITQRLIDLSERKVTLINLKILTENVLKKVGKDNARILIQRYVDGLKSKEIAENFGVSTRTVFRKLEVAEQTFSRKLQIMGYDANRLKDFLKDEKWINNAYMAFSSKGEQDFYLSNSALSKAASM